MAAWRLSAVEPTPSRALRCPDQIDLISAHEPGLDIAVIETLRHTGDGLNTEYDEG